MKTTREQFQQVLSTFSLYCKISESFVYVLDIIMYKICKYDIFSHPIVLGQNLVFQFGRQKSQSKSSSHGIGMTQEETTCTSTTLNIHKTGAYF